jgi:hypothetical protein
MGLIGGLFYKQLEMPKLAQQLSIPNMTYEVIPDNNRIQLTPQDSIGSLIMDTEDGLGYERQPTILGSASKRQDTRNGFLIDD